LVPGDLGNLSNARAIRSARQPSSRTNEHPVTAELNVPEVAQQRLPELDFLQPVHDDGMDVGELLAGQFEAIDIYVRADSDARSRLQIRLKIARLDIDA
jgi:hypothetical protein